MQPNKRNKQQQQKTKFKKKSLLDGPEKKIQNAIGLYSLFEFHHNVCYQSHVIINVNNQIYFLRNRTNVRSESDYYQVYFLYEITLRETITCELNRNASLKPAFYKKNVIYSIQLFVIYKHNLS